MILSVVTDVLEKPATSIFIGITLCDVPKFKTIFYSGIHNYRASGLSGDQVLYGEAWVHRMRLALLYQPSGP